MDVRGCHRLLAHRDHRPAEDHPMRSPVRTLLQGHRAGQEQGRSRARLRAALLVLMFLSVVSFLAHDIDALQTWVGATLPMQAGTGKTRALRVASTDLVFDPNSVVDMTEQKLLGTTLRLTSSVFGFPDFNSLADLQNDGTIRFYGGMISEDPGTWCVEEGNSDDGERPEDLYLQFTQPLTETYKKAFVVPGGRCLWRAKLDIRETKARDGRPLNLKVALEGGIVVSERDDGKKTVREGVFRAKSVTKEAAALVQKRNAEAFERALTTPKGESSGFKTPARIAGAGIRNKVRSLPGARDKDEPELEDDV